MAGDVAEDFLIGLGIGDDAADIAELGEEKCCFLFKKTSGCVSRQKNSS